MFVSYADVMVHRLLAATIGVDELPTQVSETYQLGSCFARAFSVYCFVCLFLI